METHQHPVLETRSILDLGTGAGPLAVALAKELKHAHIWATDVSEAALGYAKRNAEAQDLGRKIQFCLGDLWQAINGIEAQYDVIVSNPPYIDSKEMLTLPREVRDYEPHIALDGGEGGFFYIDKIIRKAPKYLKRGGWLLLEMDPDQTGRAKERLKSIPEYIDEKRVKDYSHRYRIVMARRILT